MSASMWTHTHTAYKKNKTSVSYCWECEGEVAPLVGQLVVVARATHGGMYMCDKYVYDSNTTSLPNKSWKMYVQLRSSTERRMDHWTPSRGMGQTGSMTSTKFPVPVLLCCFIYVPPLTPQPSQHPHPQDWHCTVSSHEINYHSASISGTRLPSRCIAAQQWPPEGMPASKKPPPSPGGSKNCGLFSLVARLAHSRCVYLRTRACPPRPARHVCAADNGARVHLLSTSRPHACTRMEEDEADPWPSGPAQLWAWPIPRARAGSGYAHAP